MLFALSLCHPKPVTRSATGSNHIVPPACFPSCPWVQHQPPRAHPTLPRVQDPTPIPMAISPCPSSPWQVMAGPAQPAAEQLGAAPAPASGTSLGTGACQAQAGTGGLKLFLGLKAATYSRRCVILQSRLWGQGTCCVPAMGAPIGPSPLV